VVDKLALLGLPAGAGADGLTFLLPPAAAPTGPNGLTAAEAAAWLLRRISGGAAERDSHQHQQQQQQRRRLEAKGDNDDDRHSLVAAVARLGITGLDPVELRRGHGPVYFSVCVHVRAGVP
jgi:hypothetical protein